MKASQYVELANDLEINKAITYLRQKDFNQVSFKKVFRCTGTAPLTSQACSLWQPSVWVGLNTVSRGAGTLGGVGEMELCWIPWLSPSPWVCSACVLALISWIKPAKKKKVFRWNFMIKAILWNSFLEYYYLWLLWSRVIFLFLNIISFNNAMFLILTCYSYFLLFLAMLGSLQGF